jgi:hypothetical protein
MNALSNLECLAVGLRHDLRDAVVIAQVHEKQSTVITDTMYPPGQSGDRSDIRCPQLSARMGPVAQTASPADLKLFHHRRPLPRPPPARLQLG